MSNSKLTLAIPSKGRLKDDTVAIFAEAGMHIKKRGSERGYQGVLEGLDGIEVIFSSASEIAYQLKQGRVHLGVTGEDLVREAIYDAETFVEFSHKLNFGHANVVVAVPACWLDVNDMQDLDEVSAQFHGTHGRRLRVATKYMMITRRFFADKGIVYYRIVESLGATEGAPAHGSAELIVDITSTGQTLKANNLKILSDGVILKSEANLVKSNEADWTHGASELCNEVIKRIGDVCEKRGGV